MSYYLKYRPQKVEDLDMAVAREALGSVLSSGRFAHTYLLSGPKGTGKTSSARILAKVLNCASNEAQFRIKNQESRIKRQSENDNDQADSPLTPHPSSLNEPCGECDSCLAIKQGSSLAVIEMDAASNRGIDDIRQLKEQVGLAPAQGLFTIYVIDEVHMLTTEAFNALLKTLEEPPAHAVFVLCTTETHKIPDTVLSRCTKLSFKKATVEEVVHSLQKAVLGENLDIEAGVLELIGQRVDGSFRDGMKILEQMSSRGEKVTLAMVNEMTGFSSEYDVASFVQALLQKEVQAALAYLAERDSMGVDWGVLGKRVVEGLRNNLLAEVTNHKSQVTNKVQTSNFQIANVMRLIDLFSKAVVEIKQAVVPQLPLELAVVEWGMERQVERGTQGMRSTQGTRSPQSDQVEQAKPENQLRQAEQVRSEHQVKQADQVVSASQVKSLNQLMSVNQVMRDKQVEQAKAEKQVERDKQVKPENQVSLDDVQRRWNEVMLGVRPYNHSLEALLRAARPTQVESNWIILEVFYAFHKEQLEQERYLKILEQVIGTVYGQGLRLRFILTNGAAQAAKHSDVTGKLKDEHVAEVAEEMFG